VLVVVTNTDKNTDQQKHEAYKYERAKHYKKRRDSATPKPRPEAPSVSRRLRRRRQ